jgi:hypothetical protein
MGKSLNEQLKTIVSKISRRTNFNATIRVGFGEEAHSSGMSASELAKLLNFGNDKFIPDRPFMTIDFPEHLKSTGLLTDVVKDYVVAVIDRPGAKSGQLTIIGDSLVSCLQEYIISNPYAGGDRANAPRTIRRKKKDHPLVETGELVGLVKAVISS